MKLGSRITVHCKEVNFGDTAVVMLYGQLLGETKSSITVGVGGRFFVIPWEGIIYLERLEEDNL